MGEDAIKPSVTQTAGMGETVLSKSQSQGKDPVSATLPSEPLMLVANKTARRIALQSRDGDDLLIIAPFGKRSVMKALLKRFNYQAWVLRNLIEVTPVSDSDGPGDTVMGAVGFVIILLLIGVPLGVFVPNLRPTIESLLTWGNVYWIALTTTLSIILLTALKWWSSVQQFTSRSLSYLVLLLVGFGLPTLYASSISDYVSFQRGVNFSLYSYIVLYMLIIFIGTASVLPALLYFLFERQKATTLRENLLRDVIRLDPSTETLDDAESIYGSSVDEAFSSATLGHFLLGSGLPILISTILLTLGWTIALLPTGTAMLTLNQSADDVILRSFFAPRGIAIVFGFLGAYFFSLNMVFRRYVRSDLGPKAYSHITMRILLTLVLVWVITLPAFTGNETFNAAAFVLAFVIGIFPDTALGLINDFMKQRLGGAIPALQEEHPLTKLEGVTLYDQARLLEEGVENVESLAHHNLVELMLRTRIPTPRLVDFVDQAILYLHLRGASAAATGATASALAVLRGYGIRTATDFEQAHAAAQVRQQDTALLALLDEPNAKFQRLTVILDTLADDQWMSHLRHWRKLNQATSDVYTLTQFDDAHARAAVSAVNSERRAVNVERSRANGQKSAINGEPLVVNSPSTI